MIELWWAIFALGCVGLAATGLIVIRDTWRDRMCNGNCNQGRNCDCADEMRDFDRNMAALVIAGVIACVLVVGLL